MRGGAVGCALTLAVSCLCFLLFASAALAQSSATSISFQGVLNGANGQPLTDGSYNLTFRFYTNATTPFALGVTHVSNVTVSGSVASTAIPVQPAWFDGQTRYLGTSVNGGAELAPRVMVTAVPYAISAGGLGESLHVAANGNLGIGTNSPQAKLDVVGDLRASYLTLSPADDHLAEGGQIDVNGAEGFPSWSVDVYFDQFRVFNDLSGNVPFSISSGDGVTRVHGYLSIDYSDGVHGEGGELVLKGAPGHPDWRCDVRNDQFRIFNSSSGRVPFSVDSGSEVTSVKMLRIEGGSDLAEPFDVTSPGPDTTVAPGMVMVIDRERDGKLTPCARAYDTAVAGVLSGANGLQPGMVMQAEGQPHAAGEHPLAMTGRVWCLADASHGAIQRGDRLTTSPTVGHAMKALDPARADGAVIGKAMSELESGTGLVLVLVNLQ